MCAYPKINSQASTFFFFFPFCCKKDSGANLNDMAEAIISTPLSSLLKLSHLPPKLKDRKPNMDDKIWRIAELNLSDDLHPHIALILGHSDQGAGPGIDDVAMHEQHQLYELMPAARNVLTGGWGQLGMGLGVALSASARRRLGILTGESAGIRVIIDTAYLQFFRSDICMLIIECSYRCDTDDLPFAEVILEANYQLCHAGKQAQNSLVWGDATKNETQNNREDSSDAIGDEPVFSLNELAFSLVTCGTVGENDRRASLQQQIDWMTRTRIFSYCAVQFKEAFADEKTRRQFAHRLCNKYTSDYSVHDENIHSTLVPTFDNVLHGASIEGGCVVVEEGEVGFLKNYASNAGRKVYLPLAVVSFHEFRYLLSLTQESAIYVKRGLPSENDIAQLRCLQYDLINFHLFFRFSHVSLISLHNVVHQAWRKAFHLDYMLEEVTSDVLEAEKLLSAEVVRRAEIAEKEKEQRWRVWSTVATWISVYFMISHFIEIWRKPLAESSLQLASLKVFNKLATVADFEMLQHEIHRTEVIFEGVAVVVAAVVALFVYRRKSQIKAELPHGR